MQSRTTLVLMAVLASALVAVTGAATAHAKQSTGDPPALGTPGGNPAPGKHCESALPQSGNGAWACVDAYAHNGVTRQFGELDFDPGRDLGASISTAASQGRTRFARNAQSPSVTDRVLTHTYQDDASIQADYGYYVGSNLYYVGTVRSNAHININGRQIQTTMTGTTVGGPPVIWDLEWSSGCGANGASSSSYVPYFAPGRQDAYCDFDSSYYRNDYTVRWWAPSLPYTYQVNYVSSSWQCQGIYTAPCYFGT